MTVEDTRKHSISSLRLELGMFSLVFEGSNRRLESGGYPCKNSERQKYKVESGSLGDGMEIRKWERELEKAGKERSHLSNNILE